MRRLSSAMVTLALVGCAAACGGSTEAPGAAESAFAYPAPYRTLALPEITGGTVVYAGRQSVSLQDGLAVTVMSAKSVDQARTFYQEALTHAGWTAAPQGRGASVPNLPVAMLTFSKERLTYTATITAVPTGTRIEIRVVER